MLPKVKTLRFIKENRGFRGAQGTAPGTREGGWELPRPASADAGEPKHARERSSTDSGYEKVSTNLILERPRVPRPDPAGNFRTKNMIFERPTSEPLPEHTRKLLDSNFSFGSAEVGAALSNVPLLRSGLGLEKYSKTVCFLLGGGRICIMG